MTKRLLSLVLFGFLTACAFGLATGCAFGADEGKTSRDNRALERLEELRTQMGPIVGLWTGTLTRAGQPIQISADIRGEPQETGQRDADGSPVYTLNTTITMSSTDHPTNYNASFRGVFFPSSSSYQIVVTNPTAANIDDLRALELRFENGTLSGPLRSVSQYLGDVVLTRSGGQQGGGTGGDEEARHFYNERKRVGYLGESEKPV